jgi:hypothetical protein
MGTAPVFASAGEALEVAYAALGYLAAADATGMAAEEQAGCLQVLEKVTSVTAAARSSVLGAFTAGKGYSADADHSPRAWLIHKTGITRHAAVSYTAWAKRAAAHPQVFAVLAAGDVSESFARTVCVWTGRLPLESRDKADAILMAAACSGLGLRDLAVLAGEMLARCWQPDRPDPGPEPGPGPGLDGRPDGNGEPGGEPAGQCGGDPPGGEPGRDDAGGDRPGGAGPPDGGRDEVFEDRALRLLVTFQGTGGTADDGSADAGPATVPPGFTRPCAVRSREALEQAIVGQAAALLSGPGGLASFPRRRQLGTRLAGPSLPLDIGYAGTVPASIRNAVRLRDRHCQWAGGCDQPAAACGVHHTTHKADGGKTSLKDCVLLCRFHHLIAIHRWGWTLVVNPDGTTTAWNKDKTRILHSHSPPARAG